MTLAELKKRYPDLVRDAIIEPQLSDEQEVMITETSPSPSPAPTTGDDKDQQIADLKAQLVDLTNMLAENARQADKDTTNTNITINVDKATNGKRGRNPLLDAFRRMRQGRIANVSSES